MARSGVLKTTTTKELTMPTGTVKWFNISKGLGFVTPLDGQGDVFVHLSALRQGGFDAVEGLRHRIRRNTIAAIPALGDP